MTVSNIVREKKGGGVLIREKKFLRTNPLSDVLAYCFGLYMAGMTGLSRGIYPMTVFVLLILIGMALLGSTARGAPDQPLSGIWWKEVMMILFPFINPLVTGTLGLYFVAFFVVAGISWLITSVRTGKALAGILAYSLSVTVAAFMVFAMGLRIVILSGVLRQARGRKESYEEKYGEEVMGRSLRGATDGNGFIQMCKGRFRARGYSDPGSDRGSHTGRGQDGR